MTNTLWKNPVDGDWTTATDWKGGLPKASKDAVINANGTYTVSLASVAAAHSLTVDAAGATFSEAAGGSLTMAGGLTVDAGTVILDGANSFAKQTRLIGGTLELGNAAALGASDLAIDGGALVGTASETLSNSIITNGSFTLAAADGDVVKLTGQTIFNMHNGDVISFGQSGDGGVLVWNPLTLGVAGTGYSVDVNFGTLRDGNGSLGEVLSAATTTIAAHAKIDIHGNVDTIGNLNGSGLVTSAVSGGTLIVDDGNFSGTITSDLALTVDHLFTLSGSNNFTGGTAIDSGAILSIEGTGSILGDIADNGILDIDRTDTVTLTLSGAISGIGSVHVENGTLLLEGSNTYTGGTTLSGGTLEIDNAAAIGTGKIILAGGTLMGIATEALPNQLAISGAETIIAAQGTTLTLNTAAEWTFGSNASLVFGSGADDGVIVWDSPAGSSVDPAAQKIAIDGGTLRAGDGNFQILLDAANANNGVTNVLQGGTLDIAGFTSTIYDLDGSGTIANSGASAVVTIEGGNFNGEFSGPIELKIGGLTFLGGDAANWNTIDLLSKAHLYLSGSSADIVFVGGSAKLSISAPTAFTGSITGFGYGDQLLFPNTSVSVGYSGTVTGGTLTVNSNFGVAHITLVGDYTHGSFLVRNYNEVIFRAGAAVVPNHADTFNFNAVAALHVATDVGITHGGHAADEIAFAHDVAEAAHVHGLLPDYVAHGPYAHSYTILEALA